MDKHTKILIPEIPGDWTDRMRSGDQNIWNFSSQGTPHRNGLPQVVISPPEIGLYAERIDNAWYWVSGCAKCNEKGERWSYVVCDKHNVCISCGTHRNALTEIPWGHPEGFMCRSCHDTQHEQTKQDALEKARQSGHSEDDCEYTDEIICPCCANVISSDDISKSQKGMECDVCDAIFDLEVEYSVSYTTTVPKGVTA